MIYVVCCTPRTGSSAFLEGVEAGGMSVATSAARDGFIARHSDCQYQVNPHSLYEPDPAELFEHGWPKQHDGQAIKLVAPFGRMDVFRFVGLMSVHQYRVVFLKRDAEEVRQSYEAVVQRRIPWLTTEYIERVSGTALEHLRNRRDCVEVVEINHLDLMAEPAAAYRRTGWPLDPERAAAVIDIEKHRYRRERLVEGI